MQHSGLPKHTMRISRSVQVVAAVAAVAALLVWFGFYHQSDITDQDPNVSTTSVHVPEFAGGIGQGDRRESDNLEFSGGIVERGDSPRSTSYEQFLDYWEANGGEFSGAVSALRQLRHSLGSEELVELTLEVTERHFTAGKSIDSNIGAGCLLLRLVGLDRPDEMAAISAAYSQEAPWAFKHAIVIALSCNTADATADARQVALAGLERIMPTIDSNQVQLRISARLAYVQASSELFGLPATLLSANRVMPAENASEIRHLAEFAAKAIDSGQLAYADGAFMMDQLFLESADVARELAEQVPGWLDDPKAEFSPTLISLIQDAARAL